MPRRSDSPQIVVVLALKLHAFGLTQIQDAVWCGEFLWDHSKRHYRGRSEPRDLFLQPNREGFLYQLGCWLFEEYWLVDSEDWTVSGQREDQFRNCSFAYIWDYMTDLKELLVVGGVDESEPLLEKLKHTLDRISQNDERRDSQELAPSSEQTDKKLLKKLNQKVASHFRQELERLKPLYARNYAERVFHDRQLCEYIAELLVEIGIDGVALDEEPGQWCPRIKFPKWVSKALHSRERGACALCGTNYGLELNAQEHIDHIIPLARGGCNDPVNLQMLCSSCNTRKNAGLIPVKSSVPPYFQQALRRVRRPV